MKWEYARLYYSGAAMALPYQREPDPASGNVLFSHSEAEREIEADGLWDALRDLGDEGWELVSVKHWLPERMRSDAREMYFKRQIQ